MRDDDLWVDEEADVTNAGGAVDAAELLHAPPVDAAVNMHVSIDAERGLVKLEFDQMVRSVSMAPDAARPLAQALRTMANDVERLAGKGKRHAARRW